MSHHHPLVDFTDLPPRRRRRREQAFYALLAGSALAAALPVIALGWQLQTHTRNLQASTAFIEQELAGLQNQLDTATRIEQEITVLEQQLQAFDNLAAQRNAAPILLDALAHATATEGWPIHLAHLGWRQQQVQLRGHAVDRQALQAYIERLENAGLAKVSLQELRATNASKPQLGYVFTLALRAMP